jgi:hypothetical protein
MYREMTFLYFKLALLVSSSDFTCRISKCRVRFCLQVIALETKIAGVVMPGTKAEIIQYLEAGDSSSTI